MKSPHVISLAFHSSPILTYTSSAVDKDSFRKPTYISILETAKSLRTFTEVTAQNCIKNCSMLVKQYPCKKVLHCSVLDRLSIYQVRALYFSCINLKCNHLHVIAVTYSKVSPCFTRSKCRRTTSLL